MLGINVRLSGASSRVGDPAIKNAVGSKYMAGGVLNWALQSFRAAIANGVKVVKLQ
jgi:hypothetical protein